MARSLKAPNRNRRGNSDIMNIETQRQAKRLGRQQKRFEKETGLAQVIDINPRQRVVKFEDIKDIQPMTLTQEHFFDAWEDEQATGYVLYGSAGTGKTYLGLLKGILDVLDDERPEYQKLIIVRSIVQSRDIGFLPGLEEKFEPYEIVYRDILGELTGKKDAYDKLKDMGKIEFVTTSFLRGVTFKNAIVLFDEMQNENFANISTVMSRIGHNCKVIMSGDGIQTDLTKVKSDVSGFDKFIQVSRAMPEFRNFRFTSDDILRSGFTKSWIMTCERLGL